MPFGGVGPAGMGHYYGKYGFDMLTHAKSMLISPPECRDRASLPALHAGEECRAQALVRILTLVLVGRSGGPEHGA
jgi:hypothetical protein